jgi:hypothetical protein
MASLLAEQHNTFWRGYEVVVAAGASAGIGLEGEFIEEQIFNWTYTDEQRAKGEFAANNPVELTPPRRLPVRSRCPEAPMPYSAFACLAGWGLS